MGAPLGVMKMSCILVIVVVTPLYPLVRTYEHL